MTVPADLVLIDGIDGSGKTLFAERWAAALAARGLPVVALHVDDVRRPVDWADPRGEAELYWSEYFDLTELESRIAAARRRGGLVLVEGIFTLRLPCAASASLVYLEVALAECVRRIVARDTHLGRTEAEVRHRIEARYFPAQERYREAYRPLERAAVLLDNLRPEAPRLVRADWTGFPDAAQSALTALLA